MADIIAWLQSHGMLAGVVFWAVWNEVMAHNQTWEASSIGQFIEGVLKAIFGSPPAPPAAK